MRKFVLLHYLCIFSLSLAVAEEKCSINTRKVDLTHQFAPNKNQGSMAWCYAYASSNLIDQYRVRNNPELESVTKERSISPLSISLLYHTYETNILEDMTAGYLELDKKNGKEMLRHQFLKGGYAEKALKVALERPLCTEEVFPTDASMLVKGVNCDTDLTPKCNFLSQIYWILKKDYQDNEEAKCKSYNSLRSLLPAFDPDTLWSMIVNLQAGEVFSDLQTDLCKVVDHQKPATPKVISKRNGRSKKLLTEDKMRYRLEEENQNFFPVIDSALEQGKAVLIVSYVNFLKSAKSHHFQMKKENDKEKIKPLASHAMVIAGKQINPTTCEVEYKIINSWGPGCNQYKTESYYERSKCITEAKNMVITPGAPVNCADPLIVNGTFDMPENCKSVYATQEDREQAEKACKEKFIPIMRNGKLGCEEPGFLIIPKSELEKNMYAYTYLE